MRNTGTETHIERWAEPIVPTRGREETVRLGSEIYERDIRHKVEKDNVGKICAIDVDSGCWALGGEEIFPDKPDAVGLLRKKRPEAVNIYCERVGFWGLRSFGGSRRRTD